MRKEDKAIVIEKITEILREYPSFYLVESAGMNAERTSDFRRACFGKDIKLVVVKNKLLEKALQNLGIDYSEFAGALKGTTSLMLSNVVNAPAKLIKDFVKKSDKLPRLKAAYVQECVYGADALETLASIKSKNELIADVVALLQSPAKNVISALSAGQKIHGLLDAIAEKKEA